MFLYLIPKTHSFPKKSVYKLNKAQSRYGIVLLILLLSFVYFRMEVPLCMLDIVVMMYY